MSKTSRRYQSIVYYARCIVGEGLAKGKTLAAVRWECRYVVEHSDALTLGDIETMVEIGTGVRAA